MRLKKSILAMVLSCLTILNVFTIPVMAAEPAASETEEIMVASVPSDAKYAGTIYRNGGTVSLGSVTLINNSKLYVYLPKNNNLDLYQGTITFRSGLNVVTKQLANYSTDKQQMNNWIHDLVSTISTRGWNNVPDMTLSIIYGKSSLKDMNQLITYQYEADRMNRQWYSVL